MEYKWYHRHVTANRDEIERSDKCGCASCTHIYPAVEVVDYIKDKQGDTAVCPYCHVDAVLGDACGKPITTELLEKLYEEWF